MKALIAAAVLIGCGSAVSTASAQSCQAPYSVGYRVIKSGAVNIGVWYPSSSREAAYSYFTSFSGSVALNGVPANCPSFPVFVFSHAYGGCGTQIAYFTEELARRGYVVAAPDHRDALCSVTGSTSQNLAPSQESFLDPGSWTDATYSDRKDDVELTIKTLIHDPNLGALSNANAIAVGGHSLGGYTAFGLAGGWPSWKDPQIKAALLFSPYIQPFQAKNSIGQVQIPLMYQGAQFDLGITPFLLGSNGAFATSNPPKFLAQLKGGTHFEWTILVCGSIPSVAGCLNASSNAQAINKYSFLFLDHLFHGDPAPELFADGPQLASYQRTTLLNAVSGASFAPAGAPESLISGFGEGLSDGVASATGAVLPDSLNGTSVNVIDQQSVSYKATLSFVSPAQVNLVLPKNIPPGTAQLEVVFSGQVIAAGTLAISSVAPAMFSAAANGLGVAAAQTVQIDKNGSQHTHLVFDPGNLVPVPISLVPSAPTYLILYGTGLRGYKSPPLVMIGNTRVSVSALVPQPEFAGLDQVNVGPLPMSLAGLGKQKVVVTIDGIAANPVLIEFQ